MPRSRSITRRKTATGPIGTPDVRKAGGSTEIRQGSPTPDFSADALLPEASASPQETFRERYPLTDEQRSTVFHDIAGVKQRLQEIAALMRACFGESSQLFVRAEECSAAVQRFEWELDRSHDNPTVAQPFEPPKD